MLDLIKSFLSYLGKGFYSLKVYLQSAYIWECIVDITPFVESLKYILPININPTSFTQVLSNAVSKSAEAQKTDFTHALTQGTLYVHRKNLYFLGFFVVYMTWELLYFAIKKSLMLSSTLERIVVAVEVLTIFFSGVLGLRMFLDITSNPVPSVKKVSSNLLDACLTIAADTLFFFYFANNSMALSSMIFWAVGLPYQNLILTTLSFVLPSVSLLPAFLFLLSLSASYRTLLFLVYSYVDLDPEHNKNMIHMIPSLYDTDTRNHLIREGTDKFSKILGWQWEDNIFFRVEARFFYMILTYPAVLFDATQVVYFYAVQYLTPKDTPVSGSHSFLDNIASLRKELGLNPVVQKSQMAWDVVLGIGLGLWESAKPYFISDTKEKFVSSNSLKQKT